MGALRWSMLGAEGPTQAFSGEIRLKPRESPCGALSRGARSPQNPSRELIHQSITFSTDGPWRVRRPVLSIRNGPCQRGHSPTAGRSATSPTADPAATSPTADPAATSPTADPAATPPTRAAWPPHQHGRGLLANGGRRGLLTNSGLRGHLTNTGRVATSPTAGCAGTSPTADPAATPPTRAAWPPHQHGPRGHLANSGRRGLHQRRAAWPPLETNQRE